MALASDGATAEPAIEEFEFSMIDQADFAGIDAYIKRHELNDASMAASRRAKKLNINKSRKGGAAAGAAEMNGAMATEKDANGDEEEESELQKAQRELEEAEVDEEDELEEDYDPGSEGDSEGEGSSSEDEYDDTARRAKQKTDLVTEELGSEAEDVSITDDEPIEGRDEPEEDEEEEEEEGEGEGEEDRDADPEADKLAAVPVSTHLSRQTAIPAKHMHMHDEPDPFDEDQL